MEVQETEPFQRPFSGPPIGVFLSREYPPPLPHGAHGQERAQTQTNFLIEKERAPRPWNLAPQNRPPKSYLEARGLISVHE